MNPIRTLLAVAVLASTLPVGAAGEQAVPAPMAMPDDSAFLVAIIPDLRATLGRAEQLAESFNPGKVQPGTFAATIGMALGDPGLANLGKGPLVVAVAPGAPLPTMALIIPAVDPQLYLAAGANNGLLMGKIVAGLAVVAQTPDGQALGEKVAAAYAGLSTTPAGIDLRLLMASDRAAAAYGPLLTGLVMKGAMSLPQAPGQPPLAKILQLEVAGLLAIAAETRGVQLDIGLHGGSISIDDVVAAAPGSALAKLCVSLPAVHPNRMAARFSAGTGIVSVVGQIDIKAQLVYFADLLGRLQTQPSAKDLITPELIEQVRTWPMPLTGDFAMRMRPGAQAPFEVEAAYGHTDAGQAQLGIDRGVALMSGDNTLAKLYRDMGMTLTYTKNVRNATGVAIHRLSWTVDGTKLPPERAEALKAMLPDSEVAIAKDWMCTTQDPKALDALIAGAGPGLVTKAETGFGTGRQLYADLDVIGLLKAQAKSTAGNLPPEAKELFATLQSGEPIVFALTSGDGRMHLEMRVPLAPFVDMAKAGRLRAEERQQRAPQPPQPPQPPANGGNTF